PLDRQGDVGPDARRADRARLAAGAALVAEGRAVRGRHRVSATLALFVLAAATSLGLAGLAVARRPRGVLGWRFAGGRAGVAAESTAGVVPGTQAAGAAE